MTVHATTTLRSYALRLSSLAGPTNTQTTTAGEVAHGAGTTVEVPVTLDTVPVYLRGGHIIARRERARRSTAAMHGDPLTLVGCPRHAPALRSAHGMSIFPPRRVRADISDCSFLHSLMPKVASTPTTR